LVPPGDPSSSSVGGPSPVGREWRGLCQVGVLGRRVVKLLSRLLVSRSGLATRRVAQRSSHFLSARTGSSVRIAAARPSLDGFCPKDGMPVEGHLATVRRCRPITVAGVMEWCPGEAIITVCGMSSLMLSPVSHLLHHAGYTACTVFLSGGSCGSRRRGVRKEWATCGAIRGLA